MSVFKPTRWNKYAVCALWRPLSNRRGARREDCCCDGSCVFVAFADRQPVHLWQRRRILAPLLVVHDFLLSFYLLSIELCQLCDPVSPLRCSATDLQKYIHKYTWKLYCFFFIKKINFHKNIKSRKKINKKIKFTCAGKDCEISISSEEAGGGGGTSGLVLRGAFGAIFSKAAWLITLTVL